MFQTNILDIAKECWAIANPSWNHKFRPVTDTFEPAPVILPDHVIDTLHDYEAALGVTAYIYGGALASLQHSQIPKDYDGYLVAPRGHPLLMLGKLEETARRFGHQLEPYSPRIRHLWKRTRIRTQENALLDLGCLVGDFQLETFASDPDVSVCAQASTLTKAVVTVRHLEGQASQTLIFREMKDQRDRRKHLRRFFKYAIQRFPTWQVKYLLKADETMFAEYSERRVELAQLGKELTAIEAIPEKTADWIPHLQNLGFSQAICRLLEKKPGF